MSPDDRAIDDMLKSLSDAAASIGEAARTHRRAANPKPRTRAIRVPLALKLATLVALAFLLSVQQVSFGWYGAYLSGVVSVVLTSRFRLFFRHRRFRRYQAWLDRQPAANGDPYRTNSTGAR